MTRRGQLASPTLALMRCGARRLIGCNQAWRLRAGEQTACACENSVLVRDELGQCQPAAIWCLTYIGSTEFDK